MITAATDCRHEQCCSQRHAYGAWILPSPFLPSSPDTCRTIRPLRTQQHRLEMACSSLIAPGLHDMPEILSCLS